MADFFVHNLILLFAGNVILAYKVSAVFQGELDYIGQTLRVQYDVLDNVINPGSSRHRITFTNTGDQTIRTGDWAIYYTNIKGIRRPNGQNQRFDFRRYGVIISRVQGCHFRIQPTNSFAPIPPGGSLQVFYLARGAFISRTDIYPNWYVTAPGMIPRTIQSTAGESLFFVGKFDSASKWKRSNSGSRRDRYDPYTPQQRFLRFQAQDLGSETLKVLPTPVSLDILDNSQLKLTTGDWVIYVPESAGSLQEAARSMARDLLMEIVNNPPRRRYIELRNEQPNVIVNGEQSTSSEAYQLQVEVREERITVISPSSAGIFYAYQTMKSIMSADNSLPSVLVKDAPRFSFRGLHLDVGRNFQTKSAVLKLLDAMAMYKLNKFLLHLSEDEGWRLEIPGLEELSQYGSQRCHDLTKCLVPQLGSGPTNQTSGSGFYSVNDYQEILQYAKDRFIEVIPEFDMPGHSRSAVKAMERRHQRFLERGNAIGAEEFLLSDLNDQTQYLSIQSFDDNTINPCLESTYKYIDHLVRQMVQLHGDIQPLKVFHFGGDEVPGAWTNSSKCREFFRQHPEINGVEGLKRYFTYRVSDITANHGLDLGAWWWGIMDQNSNAFDRSRMRNNIVTGYAGNNVWEWGGAARAYTMANAGFQVVLCHSSHLFFDHPYEPDPEERGFYWAGRFIDTKKIFGYLPDSFYDNADVTTSGAPYTPRDLCGADGSRCVPLRRPENIQGLQALVWSETIRTEEEMNYMIFPRLLSMAERAWHKGSWELIRDLRERDRQRDLDWDSFVSALGHKELLRLDRLGIRYRVPPPGARIVNGLLETNSVYPGLTVEMSTDGGETWLPCRNGPACGSMLLRTRSASGSRTSRMVELTTANC